MNRVIHRSLLFDALAVQKRALLEEILKVIAVQAVKTVSPWPCKAKPIMSEAEISKVSIVLGKLEQAHEQENETLTEANHVLKNHGLIKVSKMLGLE